MAVWFERYGRLYYLDPGEANYRVGDRVLVPTDSGPEVAECVWAPEWVAFAREAPAVGETVTLPEGEAVVVAHSVPTDSVVLRMSATGQVSPCSRAAVCGARRAYEVRSKPTGHRPAGSSPST